MATSSSAKKVARVAAKSGSGQPVDSDPDNKRSWLFAGGIALIILLGIGIVAFARDRNIGLGSNDVAPKANLNNGEAFDHWHAAFAINVCGTELAPLADGATDPLGIHTHSDGLIHIHPFTRSAAGAQATLGKYFPQVNLTVTDEGFELPDGMTMEDGGTTVKEGVTTCGGEEGELVLAYWAEARSALESPPDEIFREGFNEVPFDKDLTGFTLAYVAKGSDDVPAPSASPEIEQLGAADGGGSAPSSGGQQTIPLDDLVTEEPEVSGEPAEGSGQ